jgi:hypothetical protein
MTTLLDVRRGDQFLMALRCTDRDATVGLTFNMFSANRAPVGALVIAPAGTFTGQLASTPDQVPVTLVTGFTPLQVGDVLQRDGTGETAVVRRVSLNLDGSIQWSSSVTGGGSTYTAGGWQVIGHVVLDQ